MNNVSSAYNTSNTVLPNGVTGWYHIVAIFDGANNEKSIYVNGALDKTTSLDGLDMSLFLSNENLRIGNSKKYDGKEEWYFNGKIY